MPTLSSEEIARLRVEFAPLVGLHLNWLALPREALPGFEPSQVAVIVNTLLDGALPQIPLLATDADNRARLNEIGLTKAPRQFGDREAYPDYVHKSGYRIELKGLFVDNAALGLKRPASRREPSARLKENVTVAQVEAARDVLMLAAVQLQEIESVCRPVIVDIGLFPMIECVLARDARLLAAGGRWHHGTPQVLKKSGGLPTGRILSDADYERDTNFGKLKRIPHPPLQAFLRKHGIVAVNSSAQDAPAV